MSGTDDKYRVPKAADTTVVDVAENVAQPGTLNGPSTPDQPDTKSQPAKTLKLPDLAESERNAHRHSESANERTLVAPRKSLRVEPKLVRLTSSFQLEKFGQAWHRFEPLPETTRGEVEVWSGRNGHWVHRPYLKQYWKGKDDHLVMVRESTERRSAWTELFFDLVL